MPEIALRREVWGKENELDARFQHGVVLPVDDGRIRQQGEEEGHSWSARVEEGGLEKVDDFIWKYCPFFLLSLPFLCYFVCQHSSCSSLPPREEDKVFLLHLI